MRDSGRTEVNGLDERTPPLKVETSLSSIVDASAPLLSQPAPVLASISYGSNRCHKVAIPSPADVSPKKNRASLQAEEAFPRQPIQHLGMEFRARQPRNLERRPQPFAYRDAEEQTSTFSSSSLPWQRSSRVGQVGDVFFLQSGANKSWISCRNRQSGRGFISILVR